MKERVYNLNLNFWVSLYGALTRSGFKIPVMYDVHVFFPWSLRPLLSVITQGHWSSQQGLLWRGAGLYLTPGPPPFTRWLQCTPWSRSVISRGKRNSQVTTPNLARSPRPHWDVALGYGPSSQEPQTAPHGQFVVDQALQTIQHSVVRPQMNASFPDNQPPVAN